MTIGSLTWVAVGLGFGALHATGLWDAAHRAGGRLGLPWRLPLVAALLVLAALVGQILLVTGGWAAGLVATAVLFLLRQRQWT